MVVDTFLIVLRLGVGISTIKKFTSGRGWGMALGLSYKAFNLPSHSDHKYIYGLGVGISTIKRFTSGRGGVWPWGLSYDAFNLPSHPDHKSIWFRVGIWVTFFN
jgi:hypothetical protein